jgi:hypothetical protein
MEHPFVSENTREQKRLKALVSRLTDAQLSQPIDENWTIGVALGHLAFWDQRNLSLLRKWASKGVSPEPIDIELTNECLLPLWRALPPRVAADLAVSAAEAIDSALEEMPAFLIAEIEQKGVKFRFKRSEHRKMHLDEIENVLKR